MPLHCPKELIEKKKKKKLLVFKVSIIVPSSLDSASRETYFLVSPDGSTYFLIHLLPL